jgi:two-component system, sensor histidine kinase PdtaS
VRAVLPPEKALSIGLIVNELVTNAVKYAFEEGRAGNVDVDLSRENSRFLLTVSDAGRGYLQSAEAGFGTRLVTTFAD